MARLPTTLTLLAFGSQRPEKLKLKTTVLATLVTSNNNTAGYVTVKKGSLVVRHAAIVRWENDRFLVRTGCCGNVSYKINQPPAQEEDQWKLILDGTEYIRE